MASEHLPIFKTGPETTNLIPDVLSSSGRMDMSPRIPKRQREDDEEEGDEGASGSHKRARTCDVDSRLDNQYIDEGVRWTDYVCDDSDGTDSTYTPSIRSSEDDDAHMTQEDLEDAQEYIEKAMRCRDLHDITGDLSSGGETEGSNSDDELEIGMLWKDYPSEDESDSEDPDYVPPAWNFEDVLEVLGHKAAIAPPYYKEMDRLLYINELIDRGPMSDAGISDSDEGTDPGDTFHDLFTLRRSISFMYDVPHHLKSYSTLAPYLRKPHLKSNRHCLLRDLRKETRGWYKFYAQKLAAQGRQRREELGWEICDMDARLATILTNDHLEYAFDHDEWKGFENPRRSVSPAT